MLYLTSVVDDSSRSMIGFLSIQPLACVGGSHSARSTGASRVLAPAPRILLNGSIPAGSTISDQLCIHAVQTSDCLVLLADVQLLDKLL